MVIPAISWLLNEYKCLLVTINYFCKCFLPIKGGNWEMRHRTFFNIFPFPCHDRLKNAYNTYQDQKSLLVKVSKFEIPAQDILTKKSKQNLHSYWWRKIRKRSFL